MAHEQNAAQLEDVKDQIAEESAKAAGPVGSAAGLSRGSGNRGDGPAPAQALAQARRRYQARVVDALDLVFVIDTTASMTR